MTDIEKSPDRNLQDRLSQAGDTIRHIIEEHEKCDARHFTFMFKHPFERRLYFVSSTASDHEFLLAMATGNMMKKEWIREHSDIIRDISPIIGTVPKWYVLIYTDSISANTPVFCITPDYVRFLDLFEFLDEKYFH